MWRYDSGSVYALLTFSTGVPTTEPTVQAVDIPMNFIGSEETEIGRNHKHSPHIARRERATHVIFRNHFEGLGYWPIVLKGRHDRRECGSQRP